MSSRDLYEELVEGFKAWSEREEAIKQARKSAKPVSKMKRLGYCIAIFLSFALAVVLDVALIVGAFSVFMWLY